jgi:hypothetical protein
MDPIEDCQVELHQAEETILSVVDRLDLPESLERKALLAVRLVREVRHAVGVAACELATA